MADFGYLDAQSVKPEQIAKCVIHGITLPNGKNPVLYGKFAGEGNPPFHSAQLKRQTKRSTAIQAALKSGVITPEMVKQGREDSYVLFPQFVLTDWEVVDGKSKGVKFNAADCEKFLRAIPTQVFDEEVKAFFEDYTNFRNDAPTTDEAMVEGND